MGWDKGCPESFRFIQYNIYFHGVEFSLAEEAKIQSKKKNT
jgi:hypothetical protein